MNQVNPGKTHCLALQRSSQRDLQPYTVTQVLVSLSRAATPRATPPLGPAAASFLGCTSQRQSGPAGGAAPAPAWVRQSGEERNQRMSGETQGSSETLGGFRRVGDSGEAPRCKAVGHDGRGQALAGRWPSRRRCRTRTVQPHCSWCGRLLLPMRPLPTRCCSGCSAGTAQRGVVRRWTAKIVRCCGCTPCRECAQCGCCAWAQAHRPLIPSFCPERVITRLTRRKLRNSPPLKGEKGGG